MVAQMVIISLCACPGLLSCLGPYPYFYSCRNLYIVVCPWPVLFQLLDLEIRDHIYLCLVFLFVPSMLFWPLCPIFGVSTGISGGACAGWAILSVTSSFPGIPRWRIPRRGIPCRVMLICIHFRICICARRIHNERISDES